MGVKAKAVYLGLGQRKPYCVTIYKDGKPEYFGHFISQSDVQVHLERVFGQVPIEFTTLKKGGK